MPMSKEKFLGHVKELYDAMNMADSSDNPEKAPWMHYRMAADFGCGHLDQLMRGLVELKVITSDEHQEFYDRLGE